jgi:hypothetical protein
MQGELIGQAKQMVASEREYAARNSITSKEKGAIRRKKVKRQTNPNVGGDEFAAEITPRLPRSGTG